MISLLNTSPFDRLPLWGVLLILILIGLFAIEAGYRLGKRWLRGHEGEKDPGIGALAGATLALLAFLMAFVTSMAVGRFDNRRLLIVEEANAIGTTYLRAGYLDEPYRTEIRDLLREYVDVRIPGAEPADIDAVRANSEQLHEELWTRAEALARAHPDSPTLALFIASLNEVIDLHSKRLLAITGSRIPPVLWWALLSVIVLALILVGFQLSFDERRHYLALFLLVLVLSSVALLIADLDRPQEGTLRVSQQALIDLQTQLRGPMP
jgi:hypothetical protein